MQHSNTRISKGPWRALSLSEPGAGAVRVSSLGSLLGRCAVLILMSGTFPIAGSLDAIDRGRGEVAEGMTGDDACLGLLVCNSTHLEIVMKTSTKLCKPPLWIQTFRHVSL